MTEPITAKSAVLAERSPFIVNLIFQSGPICFLAWVVVGITLIAALVTIIRHLITPGCHEHGIYFYQIAHIAFYIVVHYIGIGPLMYIYCGPMSHWVQQALTEVGIGVAVLLCSGLAVYMVTRVRPKPTLWGTLGIAATITSFAVILIGLTIIGSN